MIEDVEELCPEFGHETFVDGYAFKNAEVKVCNWRTTANRSWRVSNGSERLWREAGGIEGKMAGIVGVDMLGIHGAEGCDKIWFTGSEEVKTVLKFQVSAGRNKLPRSFTTLVELQVRYWSLEGSILLRGGSWTFGVS